MFGKIWLFSLLTWHFMSSRTPAKLTPRNLSGSFACLASHPSLAICKGATIKVAKARCHNCSSKQCLSFGTNEPRSLQQMRLCKNHHSGTEVATAVQEQTDHGTCSYFSRWRSGAFVEVAIARCHYCFSKPCLLFSLFGPSSLQQRQLPKNCI